MTNIIDRAIKWVPMPTERRLRLQRALLGRRFAKAKEKAVATAATLVQREEALEAVRGDFQLDWDLQALGEAQHHTMLLYQETRRLRLPWPASHTEGGDQSDLFEQLGWDGTYFLSLKGEGVVRAMIRDERKARDESWSRRVTMWGALVGAGAGIVAAATGIITAWGKLHP